LFERFTERARQVVVLAQDEARALKHNYIGTEHILLGLLREEEGLAARVLESLDITVEEVRAQVARIVGQGDEVTTGQIPFTPRAKKVLELSLREALALGHNYIGTEHVLLGLVREEEGVAARVLLDFDADAESIRDQVVRMLSEPSRRADWAELEAYRPSSPALTDEDIQEFERTREEVAAAIEEYDLARATDAEYRYEALARSARRRERNGRLAAEPGRSRTSSASASALPEDGSRRSLLVLGWILFAVAFALGIGAGWLIWG
jgi:ATP-dependent Clp protease ATP-binding subunit ClpC